MRNKLCIISLSGCENSQEYRVIGVKANDSEKCSINTAQAMKVIENCKEITFYIQRKTKFKFFNWISKKKIQLLLDKKESNKSYEIREFKSLYTQFSLKYFKEN